MASVKEVRSLRSQGVKQELPKGEFLPSAWYLVPEPSMGSSVFCFADS